MLKKQTSTLEAKLRNADLTGTENGEIRIVEVGFKMQLPADIKDLMYFYNPRSHAVMFSTRSLMSVAYADAVGERIPEAYHCSPGSNPIGVIGVGINKVDSPDIVESRQVGKYFFHLFKPKANNCGRSDTTRDLQIKQAILLQSAFRTLVDYKEINFQIPKTPSESEFNFGL